MLKHISGEANKVADALNRKSLVFQEGKIQVLGLKFMKELYEQDSDFQEAFKACKNPMHFDKGKWIEFMIQDGLLFRNSQLCIPKSSMRDNLIRNKHSGGLANHFGHDKTFEQLQHFYYWPRMRSEVQSLQADARFFNIPKGKVRM